MWFARGTVNCRNLTCDGVRENEGWVMNSSHYLQVSYHLKIGFRKSIEMGNCKFNLRTSGRSPLGHLTSTSATGLLTLLKRTDIYFTEIAEL